MNPVGFCDSVSIIEQAGSQTDIYACGVIALCHRHSTQSFTVIIHNDHSCIYAICCTPIILLSTHLNMGTLNVMLLAWSLLLHFTRKNWLFWLEASCDRPAGPSLGPEVIWRPVLDQRSPGAHCQSCHSLRTEVPRGTLSPSIPHVNDITFLD